MRLLLLAILLVLPVILAIPSPREGTSSGPASSLFGRFASLLLKKEESPMPFLSVYESEDGYDAPVPRGLATENNLEKRFKTSSSYPKCRTDGKRNGYAHYPGWKIVGDDLSGALPVTPRWNCVKVCDGYGDACSGTFYDDALDKCFLKGTKVQSWKFIETDQEGDAVDLIGGCAAWSEAVPEEMDEVCCRD